MIAITSHSHTPSEPPKPYFIALFKFSLAGMEIRFILAHMLSKLLRYVRVDYALVMELGKHGGELVKTGGSWITYINLSR